MELAGPLGHSPCMQPLVIMQVPKSQRVGMREKKEIAIIKVTFLINVQTVIYVYNKISFLVTVICFLMNYWLMFFNIMHILVQSKHVKIPSKVMYTKLINKLPQQVEIFKLYNL